MYTKTPTCKIARKVTCIYNNVFYPRVQYPTIIPNIKLKKDIHRQLFKISKRDKNMHTQKEKRKKTHVEKPHQFYKFN